MIKKTKAQPFSEVLRIVENISNNQYLSSLKMSATAALQHKPDYIAMLSSSVRYKRKNYLGNAKEPELNLFCVVRIKKFLEKQFTSSKKESYGFLSPCFMVSSIIKDRPIASYKLANLFTLTTLPGTYRRQELSVANLSYLAACQLEEKSILKVINLKNNFVEYSVQATDRLFVATKGIIAN